MIIKIIFIIVLWFGGRNRNKFNKRLFNPETYKNLYLKNGKIAEDSDSSMPYSFLLFIYNKKTKIKNIEFFLLKIKITNISSFIQMFRYNIENFRCVAWVLGICHPWALFLTDIIYLIFLVFLSFSLTPC